MFKKEVIAVHILLKIASTKKRTIQNRALNSVINSLVENKENFDKNIPKTIKVRYGRAYEAKE